jgi:hypothetical protein
MVTKFNTSLYDNTERFEGLIKTLRSSDRGEYIRLSVIEGVRRFICPISVNPFNNLNPAQKLRKFEIEVGQTIKIGDMRIVKRVDP